MKLTRRAAGISRGALEEDANGSLAPVGHEATDKPESVASTRLFERVLTPDQLADGIGEYFKLCDERGRKPTKPGLCNHLGISTSTWDNWYRHARESEESGQRGSVADRYKAFIWPMKNALQRMGDELEQRTDTMAVFLLKQACYGGYSDKCESGAAGNLSVNITFGETHKNTARGYGK